MNCEKLKPPFNKERKGHSSTASVGYADFKVVEKDNKIQAQYECGKTETWDLNRFPDNQKPLAFDCVFNCLID